MLVGKAIPAKEHQPYHLALTREHPLLGLGFHTQLSLGRKPYPSHVLLRFPNSLTRHWGIGGGRLGGWVQIGEIKEIKREISLLTFLHLLFLLEDLPCLFHNHGVTFLTQAQYRHT